MPGDHFEQSTAVWTLQARKITLPKIEECANFTK